MALTISAAAQPSFPPGASTPRDHEVHSASSTDGLTWTRDEGIRLTMASVPTVVNDNDRRILLYAVRPPQDPRGMGGVACASSTDGTNFVIETGFAIEGLSTLTAADPCVMQEADGTFKLYYLASNYRGDPANGPNPHKINVATSTDGIHYKETGTVFEYNGLVDPDVFRLKDRWFMYVATRGGTVVASSPDGKRFTYEKPMTPTGWGTVAPVTLPDGMLRLYAFDQRTPIGNTVRSFTSTDGLNWTTEPGIRLQAQANEQVTDPFVIRWRGGWKMYFKHSVAPQGFAGNRGAGSFNQPNRSRNLYDLPHPNPLPLGEGTAANAQGNTGRADSNPAQGLFLPRPAGEGRGEGDRARQHSRFNNQPPQNQNADGPWNHDVIIHRVTSDGNIQRIGSFERAGVPTITRMKDGRLIAAHQYFPENDRENFDKVAVHFSSDEGHTWTLPEVIQVSGLPEGMRFPFDPTLVPLLDGRVRLYFTGNMGRTFGPGTPAIHSAISTNGVNYTYEAGTRFAVEGRAVIDCAVVLHQGVVHLFAPDNGPGSNPALNERTQDLAARPREGFGYHATSKDGLNFTRVEDAEVEGRRRWLGNAQSDGRVITFFGTGNPSPGQRGGLWMATSTDGMKWQLVQAPQIGGGDPGAVATKDGGWIVLITGAPRNVTPMGQPQPRQRFQPQPGFRPSQGQRVQQPPQ